MPNTFPCVKDVGRVSSDMTHELSYNIRRLALAVWLISMGGKEQVAYSRGLNQVVKNQIAQFFQGYSFNARAARQLERQLGLPVNLLDSIPPGYEAVQDTLAKSDLHAIWCQITGHAAADLAMIDQINHVQDDLSPDNMGKEATHHHEPFVGIPPIQVSPKWLNQNISNFDCVKDFCIITDHAKQDQKVNR